MVMISEKLGRKMLAQNFANFANFALPEKKKAFITFIIDHLPYGMIVE